MTQQIPVEVPAPDTTPRPMPRVESQYALLGPQVAPEAATWAARSSLRVLDQATIQLLASRVPRYPDPGPVLTGEIAFVNFLADETRRRDPRTVLDPVEVQRAWDRTVAVQPFPGARHTISPLSFFLREPLVPWQTPDAVITDRDPGATPPRPHVVNTGRGLALYFQDETPGLPHRLALQYLLQQQRIAAAAGTGRVMSPPAQAMIWAALDVAIASALLAAWYVKWEFDPTRSPSPGGRTGRARRPRPVEPSFRLDGDTQQVRLTSVLYDVSPPPPPRGTAGLLSPETPRHPAYPSGHSTYGAAASTVLAGFFPEHAEELGHLGDNTGLARLWGGVHWPSDHIAGRALGTAVGQAVLAQVRPLDSGAGGGITLDRVPPLLAPPVGPV